MSLGVGCSMSDRPRMARPQGLPSDVVVLTDDPNRVCVGSDHGRHEDVSFVQRHGHDHCQEGHEDEEGGHEGL